MKFILFARENVAITDDIKMCHAIQKKIRYVVLAGTGFALKPGKKGGPGTRRKDTIRMNNFCPPARWVKKRYPLLLRK